MTPRELRQSADAARRAYEEAKHDETLTTGELRKIKADADKAHEAWLDAATAALTMH